MKELTKKVDKQFSKENKLKKVSVLFYPTVPVVRGADCGAARSAAARKSGWPFGRFQRPGRNKEEKRRKNKEKERIRRKQEGERNKSSKDCTWSAVPDALLEVIN